MKRDKKRYKRFGMRTDTQPTKLVRDLRDGTNYIERKNGSMIPKQTTIAVTQTVKRLLNMFKELGGYPNNSDAILKLILDRKEAESFPKKLIEKAEYDSELQSEAREKAIRKGRYKRKKPVEPDKYLYE